MAKDPVPARPAATVLLLRDGAKGLEVFMVQRHREIEFLPSARVFPGGRVDDLDRTMAAEMAVSELPVGELAIRIAAVRETYEESGILLARAKGEADLVSGARLAALTQGRTRTATAAEFATLLAEGNLVPAVDVLVPYAHWITPEPAPKRFDTHFFLAIAPTDQMGRHDGQETVDSAWITPAEVVAESQHAHRELALPTRLNLKMVAESATAVEACAAARARKIVTVMPKWMPKDGDGGTLRIPIEAGYGADTFEFGSVPP